MLKARWPLFFGVFAIAFSFVSFAHADVSLAVVDVKRIMTQSDAAKSIQEQRETLKAQYLSEISDKEQALRDMEGSLAKAAADLSEEDRLTKRQEYERKLIETRRFAQTKKRALETASSKATNTLRDTLYSIVQEIAAEEQYDLVISNQNVIMGQNSLDITEETLERLNENTPTISLNLKAE